MRTATALLGRSYSAEAHSYGASFVGALPRNVGLHLRSPASLLLPVKSVSSGSSRLWYKTSTPVKTLPKVNTFFNISQAWWVTEYSKINADLNLLLARENWYSGVDFVTQPRKPKVFKKEFVFCPGKNGKDYDTQSSHVGVFPLWIFAWK